jgi:4-hydroxymandelate oxidase
VIDLATLEDRAAETLHPHALDYYRGGSGDESALADNVAAWTALRLRPHVLRDVSSVSTATTVLATPVRAPVLVAPTAYHLLAHPDGESGTARGAAEAGSVMVLSTFTTQPVEDVARAGDGAPLWFQLYVNKDRGWTAELVARVRAAGCTALVLTVDLPVLGLRLRDERNGFALPPGLARVHVPPASAYDDDLGASPGSALRAHVNRDVDASMTEDVIGWLADVGGLPVVVKGVLRGDDAVRCVEAGAAALVVSNHGGRQLDGAVATARALPEVVDAVDGRVEVYVDGGVRGGSDVVRALALGARAVLVGRPVVYGLAAGGWAGVRDVLDAYAEDTARALALCGAASVDDVTADLLAREP